MLQTKIFIIKKRDVRDTAVILDWRVRLLLQVNTYIQYRFRFLKQNNTDEFEILNELNRKRNRKSKLVSENR